MLLIKNQTTRETFTRQYNIIIETRGLQIRPYLRGD